jgi:hypothetical protein
MRTKIKDQPPPIQSQSPAIWPLVIKDMRDRDAVGRARYGTPLQAHNGRDALVDAYQEALDLAVYLRQAIFERDQANGILAECADLMETHGIADRYVDAVREASRMAQGRQIKVGRGSVRGGKFKPADSTPKPLVKGKHAKAARAAKAWATKSKGKS